MVIWVTTLDKQLVGYLSVEDFCAMTEYSFPADGRGVKNGVEVHRTGKYIFGALRNSKQPPTLQWSAKQQTLEPLSIENTKRVKGQGG
jgi:hypothetical protein